MSLRAVNCTKGKTQYKRAHVKTYRHEKIFRCSGTHMQSINTTINKMFLCFNRLYAYIHMESKTEPTRYVCLGFFFNLQYPWFSQIGITDSHKKFSLLHNNTYIVSYQYKNNMLQTSNPNIRYQHNQGNNS